MDLSNFFYQSPMKKDDMEYLGVLHPFKGTFVYSREPQGLKNASKHGYNKLAALYGDMVAEIDLLEWQMVYILLVTHQKSYY